MSVKCTICHRELPEKSFYKKYLKHYKYQCMDCVRKQNREYQAEIKNQPQKDFDKYYGGYVITVLNYPKPFRYSIKGTNGYFFYTNDDEEFLKELQTIIGSYTL